MYLQIYSQICLSLIAFLAASGMRCFGQEEGIVINSIGMRFKLIKAGNFKMGSPVTEEGREKQEVQHSVSITKSYHLGVYEVTQEQYQKVTGKNPSSFPRQKPADGNTNNYPVEGVSWEDAIAFCQRLSEMPEEQAAGRVYRLPTEAEWEFACRAGSSGSYSFGNTPNSLGNYAWYRENAKGETHPVGEKKPNAWGLQDMHGNVWEWCQDRHGEYPNESVIDPRGPNEGEIRLCRGGSWFNGPTGCRTALRKNTEKWRVDNQIGLRIAADFSDSRVNSKIPKYQTFSVKLPATSDADDPAKATRVGLSPTGKHFWGVLATTKPTLILGHVPDRSIKYSIELPSSAEGFGYSWSSDEKLMALSCRSRETLNLLILDTETGKLDQRSIPITNRGINELRFNDNKRLCILYQTLPDDGFALGIYDIDSGEFSEVKVRNKNGNAKFVLLDSGRTALVMTDNLKAWNLESKKVIADLGESCGDGSWMCVSGDKTKLFVSHYRSRNISEWDISDSSSPRNKRNRLLPTGEYFGFLADEKGESLTVLNQRTIEWIAKDDKSRGFMTVQPDVPKEVSENLAYAITGGPTITVSQTSQYITE